jgi:hypothetical protein
VYLQPHMVEKMEAFLPACRTRMAKPMVKPKIGKWLVSTPSSIKRAASKGDPWAQSILRHQHRSVEHHVM